MIKDFYFDIIGIDELKSARIRIVDFDSKFKRNVGGKWIYEGK